MDYHELTIQLRTTARQMRETPGCEPRWVEATHLAWALRDLLHAVHEYQGEFRRQNADKPLTRWDLEGNRTREQLERTPAGAPGCLSCGQEFSTDGDFWRHYTVPDLNYPNLGNCWKKGVPNG